jgi:hypothetical protein
MPGTLNSWLAGTTGGRHRSYRLDRVNAATVTRQAFRPRYIVELTASGSLAAP